MSHSLAYYKKKKPTVFVYVLSNNFTNYLRQVDKKEKGGSAIYLINCGIQCNNTVFDRCISSGGGGGAIYIMNSFDITNNATFEDVRFIQCKADFGGAIFISISSELFNISIIRCHFDSNEAVLMTKPRGENKHLYGGSAVYLMCRNLNVVNSTFSLNKGPSGAIKIYNLFNDNSKSIKLDQSENLISLIVPFYMLIKMKEIILMSLIVTSKENLKKVHII